MLQSDDNKGPIGIEICTKISKVDREKYIKEEKDAQLKYG
jgi:hypothetical protein